MRPGLFAINLSFFMTVRSLGRTMQGWNTNMNLMSSLLRHHDYLWAINLLAALVSFLVGEALLMKDCFWEWFFNAG